MFVLILIVIALILVFVLSDIYEKKIISDFVEEHTPLSSRREIQIVNDVYLVESKGWAFASDLKKLKILDSSVSVQFFTSAKREIREIADPAVNKFILEAKDPNNRAFGYFCKFLIDGTFVVKNKEDDFEMAVLRGVEMLKVAIQSGNKQYRIQYVKAILENKELFDNLMQVIPMLEDMTAAEDDVIQEWACWTLADIFTKDSRVQSNEPLSKHYSQMAESIIKSRPEIPF